MEDYALVLNAGSSSLSSASGRKYHDRAAHGEGSDSFVHPG